MRCCSAVVAPGRTPLSRSPWRTHWRSVSAVQPILPAIDSIAAHCDGYWSLASKNVRTARSITSGENFRTSSSWRHSQSKETPQNAGRFTAIGSTDRWDGQPLTLVTPVRQVVQRVVTRHLLDFVDTGAPTQLLPHR